MANLEPSHLIKDDNSDRSKALAANQTIFVGTLNFDPSIPGQEGEAITVIGFGSTASGTLPNVLQQTTVNYIANNVCASLKSGPNSYQGKITSDMICVHGSNSGQCNGDSGGPYLLLGNSYATDVQVGIVSW